MTEEIKTKTISLTTSIPAFSESYQAGTFSNASPENRERPRNIAPDCKTVLSPSSLAGTIKAARKLRTALRLAGRGDDAQSAEIALHTLQGMRSPSFRQSQALQELARRNLADLDARLRARELVANH